MGVVTIGIKEICEEFSFSARKTNNKQIPNFNNKTVHHRSRSSWRQLWSGKNHDKKHWLIIKIFWNRKEQIKRYQSSWIRNLDNYH